MFCQKILSSFFKPVQEKDTLPLNMNPQVLILYKFDTCIFCRRVMAMIDANQWPVIYRDTQEEHNRQALVALTGKTQVPCLSIDGEPLLESRLIIRYLQQVFPTG